MKPKHPAGPPVTLDNVRHLGVHLSKMDTPLPFKPISADTVSEVTPDPFDLGARAQ